MVKVINIDPSGKIRLSRKALIAPPEGQQAAPEGGGGGRGPREGGERRERRDRDRDRDREPAKKE